MRTLLFNFIVFSLILVGVVLPVPGSAAAPPILTAAGRRQAVSLESRIAYQRAIEEVYWRHRLWPQENANPKPSLDALLSAAQLQARVEDSLRLSNALETLWQQPITGAQLQAELEQQAQNSQQPAVLRQLWAALGNDPTVIAEMLARPVLAERLARSWYAQDERFQRKTSHSRSGGCRSKLLWNRRLVSRLPLPTPCPKSPPSPRAAARGRPPSPCPRPTWRLRPSGPARR